MSQAQPFGPEPAAAVNVNDYGAIGDGHADDARALQDALDSAAPFIDVPNGTYRITRTLTVRSNKRLRLAPGAVIRRGAAINAMLINASGGAGGYDGNAEIEISGGTWDGNAQQFAAACTLVALGHVRDVIVRDTALINIPEWHGLELSATLRARVERVRFDRCTNEALQLDTPAPLAPGTFPWFGPYDDTKNVDTTITDCVFTNVATAIGSHTNPPAQNLMIRRCVVVNAGEIAIKALDYDGVTIEDCEFVACATVYAGSARGLVFRGNRITRSSVADVNLRGVADGLIEGNRIASRRTGIQNVGGRVVVRDNLITEGPALPTVNGYLSNLAVRTTVPAGESLVLGLVVADGRRNYLVRAAGPALREFGLTDVLEDPVLVVRSGRGAQLAANDGWRPEQAPAMERVGAFAFRPGSRDAALVATLDPGNYTVEIRGAGGGGGAVLVEAYDLP
jgi:hypothetical protein